MTFGAWFFVLVLSTFWQGEGVMAKRRDPSVAREAQAVRFIDNVVSAINQSGHKPASSKTHRTEIGADGSPVGANRFQTWGCANIPSEKWVALLLSDQPIQHTFKFKTGCDIEGDIAITRKITPVELQVRHLEKIMRVKASVAPDIQMKWSQKRLSVTLRAERGEFFSAPVSLMKFRADYNLAIGLTGDLEKNRGGTVFVESFKGARLRLMHKLHFE